MWKLGTSIGRAPVRYVCMSVCMLIHTGMKYPAEIKWKEEE